MLLNTKVEITGWLSPREVIPILSRADIYVQTSHWEGMPLALIEAQVLGKPAVVTDVVGNRDVVVNGFTGFTCADKTDLKEKLLSMIDDSKLRKQIGKNSYSYSVDRFGLKRLQKDLNNLYFT
jgi:glycosyltransferase involved in cell wall biosynthesis